MSTERLVDLKEGLVREPKIIGLIGPIGAGKSTFARVLGEHLGIEVVEENFTQNPYLADFYKDPKKFSHDSQMWFLNEKIKQLADLDYRKSIIIDPALEMDLIYANTLHSIGFMNDHDFWKYKEKHQFLKEEFVIRKPDLFIIVNSRIPVLESRIRQRGRESELFMLKRYPSYLANLHTKVESFYGPHVYINSEENSFTDEMHMNEHLEKIEKKIK